MFVHPCPGVLDVQHHEIGRPTAGGQADLGGADVGRLDPQHAAIRHRIAGIQGKVQQDLLDLPAVSGDVVEVLLLHDLNEDVFADQASQHRLHTADDGVEIDDSGGEQLLSAERQKLAGE